MLGSLLLSHQILREHSPPTKLSGSAADATAGYSGYSFQIQLAFLVAGRCLRGPGPALAAALG